MHETGKRSVYLLMSTAVACTAAHAVSPAITKGPYIQNPSPTAMTIQWESNVSGEIIYRKK